MGAAGSRFREVATSSLKIGAATVASLVGWIVGGKILAVELGAAGVGVFGLLRQLLQNLTVISTVNGSTPLVQGLSTRSGEQADTYAGSVGSIFAAGAVLVGVVLLVGAPWLGPWLIPHPHAPVLVRWLVLALFATTAQTYFTSILNARRAVNPLVRSQLLAPAVVLLLAVPMAQLVRGGRPFAYVLMLAAPGATVAVAAAGHAYRHGWLAPPRFTPPAARDVASFWRMSSVLLLTGLIGAGAQYLLSRMIAAHLGLEQAGLFWVAWTLSMSYVTVLLSSYGTYYMPALSALGEGEARRALIRDYLRLALWVMPVVVAAVVLIKPLVVRLMFSRELLPALEVMRWMLIGDYFKGIAWVLSFPMLAFSEMRLFFWSEAAFNVTLVGTAAVWLEAGGGIEHLGTFFMVLYAAYLIAMAVYVYKRHGFVLSWGEVATFAAGLGVVGLMSAATWADLEVRRSHVLLFCGCIAGFAAFVWRLEARALRTRTHAESIVRPVPP